MGASDSLCQQELKVLLLFFKSIKGRFWSKVTFEMRFKGQSIVFIFRGQKRKGIPDGDYVKEGKRHLEIPKVLFGGPSTMRGHGKKRGKHACLVW